jgi:hypothetical protein
MQSHTTSLLEDEKRKGFQWGSGGFVFSKCCVAPSRMVEKKRLR